MMLSVPNKIMLRKCIWYSVALLCLLFWLYLFSSFFWRAIHFIPGLFCFSICTTQNALLFYSELLFNNEVLSYPSSLLQNLYWLCLLSPSSRQVELTFLTFILPVCVMEVSIVANTNFCFTFFLHLCFLN